jgi:hypothetical protein
MGDNMSLTYEWKIKTLRKQDNPSLELNDIIVQTHWECIGTDDDGNSGTFNGATPFDPDQIDPDNFTTYENLTEEQILGWIQDVVNTNPGYKTHIDGQIQKHIDAIVRPVVDVPENEFPWAEPQANTTPEPTPPPPPPEPQANTTPEA